MPHACNGDKRLVYHELETPIISLPMKNYPFPTAMMDKLPAFPLRTACSFFKEPSLHALDQLLEFYGHECQTSDFHKNIVLGWQTLTCHELVMPNLNGDGSIFPTSEGTTYNFAAKKAFCQEVLGLTPDEHWVARNFDIHKSSNILFVNGNADPWLPTGVTRNLSDSLIAINIADAAHHLDSFLPTKDDPAPLREAREIIGKTLE